MCIQASGELECAKAKRTIEARIAKDNLDFWEEFNSIPSDEGEKR